MNGYIELSFTQVAAVTALILINGVLSLVFRLGLVRSLFVASIRTIMQLTLIGFVLQWVFHADHPLVVLLLAAAMTIIAGYTSVQRNRWTAPRMWLNAYLSIWLSTWCVTGYGLSVIFENLENWYQPQYLIPLLGMVLGNALTGISLGLQTLTKELTHERGQIETRLALGATRFEAALPWIQESVRVGLNPTLNAMNVVGIVSLPGMMTGQLVAGMNPLQAVKYQIVIMFLIAAATMFGTLGAVYLTYRQLFNAHHQFLFMELKKR